MHRPPCWDPTKLFRRAKLPKFVLFQNHPHLDAHHWAQRNPRQNNSESHASSFETLSWLQTSLCLWLSLWPWAQAVETPMAPSDQTQARWVNALMFLQQQPITKQFSVEFSTHKVNTNNEQLARNARAMKNKHKTNIVRANKRKTNCNCCCDDIETIMCLRNISQKVWKRGIKTGRTGTTSTTYIHDPSHQMAKL